MILKELVELNHGCSEMFIRESDGNFSAPVFHYHLTSGDIPKDVLERTVKHFQAGTTFKYNRTIGVLLITLYMNKEGKVV